MQELRPPLTVTVPLSGGQSRLRQLILYVASKCEGAKYFGAVKLNKIIWKADFDAFAARKVPVTGREYRRQQFGPALREMLPVHREMLKDGAIRVERRDFGDDIVEHRTIAIDQPNTTLLSADDLAFVDAAMRHYWDMTGTETSDESHGIAWKTRKNGSSMPYELAFISDEPLDASHLQRVEDLIYERGWISE